MSNIVTDSVLFLSGSRKVLASMIETSGVEDGEEAANYIVNEASDYEIISCLVNGELPDDKYNQEDEVLAWEQYRSFITENFDILSDTVDHSVLEDISENLGPVSLVGLSSQPSILEFQINSGLYTEESINTILQEGANWDAAKKVVGGAKDYWADKWNKRKAKKIQGTMDKAGKTSRSGQGDGGASTVAARKQQASFDKKGLRTSRAGQGSGGGDPTRMQRIKGAVSGALRATGRAIKKGAKAAGSAVVKGAKAAGSAVVKGAKATVNTVASGAGKYAAAVKGEKGRALQVAAIGGTAAAGAAGAYGAYKAYKARKAAKAKAKAAKEKAAKLKVASATA